MINHNNNNLLKPPESNWFFKNQPKMLQAGSGSLPTSSTNNEICKSLFIFVQNKLEPNVSKPRYGLQDLVHSFKYFLILGRVIGVIPIKGFFHGSVGGLKFRKASIAVATNIIIVIGLAFACCTGIVSFFKLRRNNVIDMTNYLGFFQFYVNGFFIYFYFLLYSKDFIRTLTNWSSIKLYYPNEDKTLKRDAHLIAALILVSIFCENFLWHMRAVTALQYLHQMSNNTNFFSFMRSTFRNYEKPLTFESFYTEAMVDWSRIYSYSPSIAIFAVTINKFSLYAWNYFDILIIITSRAIYMKFKTLNETGHKYLDDYEKRCEFGLENIKSFNSSSSAGSNNNLKNLINDHVALTNLLIIFDEFFSPIILVSYFSNIYDLCTHIANGLSPSAIVSFTSSLYSAWSFVHLTVRLFLVSLSAARINEHALGICKVLRRCPLELYTKDIEKFEVQLFHMNIGLGAFGTFIISKPFMLKILGVVFTIEIVLLQ